METTLNRRKQTLIVLLVLMLHLLLLLFFAVMQFKAPDSRAFADLLEQEIKQPVIHEEDDEIELKAHGAFGGAPVMFQDEPETPEQPQAGYCS